MDLPTSPVLQSWSSMGYSWEQPCNSTRATTYQSDECAFGQMSNLESFSALSPWITSLEGRYTVPGTDALKPLPDAQTGRLVYPTLGHQSSTQIAELTVRCSHCWSDVAEIFIG